MKKLNILLSGLALCGMALTSCDNDPVLPPVSFPEGGSLETVGTGTEESPLAVWQVLLGKDAGTDEEGIAQTLGWAEGYIVGYCDTGVASVLSADNAVFSAKGAVASNVLLANTPDETNWENCIPVQLAYGTSGRDLSLQNHPNYLGRQVTLYGTSGAKYLSVYGLRNCSAYNWGDQGIYIAPPAVFTKTTEMSDGAQYIMVADNKYIAQNLAQNYTYGYLYCTETSGGEFVESDMKNTYTFTRSGENWIITDSYGRYLYQNDSAQNFQVGEEMPSSNYLWSVEFNEDGTARITNVSRGTWIQYDSNYASYGCYNSVRGSMPVLYVLKDTEE